MVKLRLFFFHPDGGRVNSEREEDGRSAGGPCIGVHCNGVPLHLSFSPSLSLSPLRSTSLPFTPTLDLNVAFLNCRQYNKQTMLTELTGCLRSTRETLTLSEDHYNCCGSGGARTWTGPRKSDRHFTINKRKTGPLQRDCCLLLLLSLREVLCKPLALSLSSSSDLHKDTAVGSLGSTCS